MTSAERKRERVKRKGSNGENWLLWANIIFSVRCGAFSADKVVKSEVAVWNHASWSTRKYTHTRVSRVKSTWPRRLHLYCWCLLPHTHTQKNHSRHPALQWCLFVGQLALFCWKINVSCALIAALAKIFRRRSMTQFASLTWLPQYNSKKWFLRWRGKTQRDAYSAAVNYVHDAVYKFSVCLEKRNSIYLPFYWQFFSPSFAFLEVAIKVFLNDDGLLYQTVNIAKSILEARKNHFVSFRLVIRNN